MSNYIIDYLAPYAGSPFVKEAGFLSKLIKKIIPAARNKDLAVTTKNLQRIMSSPMESSLREAQNSKAWSKYLLDLYHKPNYTGPYKVGTPRGNEVIGQVRRALRKALDKESDLLSRLKGAHSSASPAYTPDMLYLGSGKGLRAAFGGTPNTASMSDALASAIAKDDALAANIAKSMPVSGSGASMFQPIITGEGAGKETAKVLTKLGLL